LKLFGSRKGCRLFESSFHSFLHKKEQGHPKGVLVLFGGDEEDLNSGFAPTFCLSILLLAKPVKRLLPFREFVPFLSA